MNTWRRLTIPDTVAVVQEIARVEKAGAWRQRLCTHYVIDDTPRVLDEMHRRIAKPAWDTQLPHVIDEPLSRRNA